MDINEKNDLFHQAKQWILEAGEIIKHKIKEPLNVKTKSNPNDLVTAVDKEIEQFFVHHIKNKYPDHFLFGEEGYGDQITTLDGTVWIIDPIDGTMNFVHQKRNFAISIGIYHNGTGEIGLVYDVMNDILYTAKKGMGAYKNGEPLDMLSNRVLLDESILGLNHLWLCNNRHVEQKVMESLVRKVRGTRTYGSAALEFAFVAEGILDGYLSMQLSPWDIAAGVVIVREVGGVTTNIYGEPLNMLEKNSILTCHPSLQKNIIQDFLERGKK